MDFGAFEAMNREEKFQRFYSENDCSYETWSQLVSKFVSEAEQYPRKNYNLAIALKSNNQFIGAAGIRIEENSQASVGCSLDRRYHLRNFAQEAMAAIAKFGFTKLDIHRIYAETISDNKAAVLLCNKFGMRKEAEFIEHKYFKGRWWNTVVFAMLEDEWRAKQKYNKALESRSNHEKRKIKKTNL